MSAEQSLVLRRVGETQFQMCDLDPGELPASEGSEAGPPAVHSAVSGGDFGEFGSLREQVAATWISGESIAKQELANLPWPGLIYGLVEQVRTAIRSETTARLLPGVIGVDQDTGAVIDTRANALAALERKLHETQLAVKNIVASLARVQNEAARATLTTELDAAHVQVARVERQIGRVTSTVALPSTPRVFDTYVEVVEAALDRLEKCENEVEQAGRVALETILPDFHVFFRDHAWWGRSSVRLNGRPRNDREPAPVFDVGPFEWRIAGARGNGSQVLRRLDERPYDLGLMSRKDVQARLMNLGLCEGAAMVAINGPGQLVEVLLHALAGEPLPMTLDDQWREPAFVDHLVRCYTDPEFVWLGTGRYTKIRHVPQAIVDFAARRDGPFTTAEAREAVPLPGLRDVAALVRPNKLKGSAKRRPVQPLLVVDDVSKPVTEHTAVSGVRCVCGRIASVICVRYEVPRELLCTCGRMPDAAKFGLDPDFRFPYHYLLRPSAEEALAAAHEHLEEVRRDLFPSAKQALLVLAEHAAEGVPTSVVSRRLVEAGVIGGVASGPQVLVQLRRYRLARCVKQERIGRGAPADQWYLTTDGVERVRLLQREAA